MDFSGINWLAVLVATVAGFAVGSVWYNPKVFGAAWQKGVGITESDIKNANMAKTFGTSFVLMLLMVVGMAMMLQGHRDPVTSWMGGLHHGLYMGLFFVFTSIGINIAYQQKSLKLWLIDAGYQTVFLMIAGAILGAWR